MSEKETPTKRQTFAGAVFTKGRAGRYYGWASDGLRKCQVELGVAVWAGANGPLPAGAKLEYIDGDFGNCDLSNLRVSGLPALKKPKAQKAKKS